jgi:hypothetical protein
MAVSSAGMIWESPWDAVEAAVEGRWVLYAAICASERAARVRPACAVSSQNLQLDGVRTFSVRRVLLDFAAELRDILPPAGTPRLVQCLQIALGLFALRGGLLL